MESVVFRFANVVGGRSRHGVVWDLVQKLKRNPRGLEAGGREPGTSKSYVYVNDAVRGILAGVDRAIGQQDVFNVGSDDSILVKDLADIVVREMGLRDVAYHWTGGVAGGGGEGGGKRGGLGTRERKGAGRRGGRRVEGGREADGPGHREAQGDGLAGEDDERGGRLSGRAGRCEFQPAEVD